MSLAVSMTVAAFMATDFLMDSSVLMGAPSSDVRF